METTTINVRVDKEMKKKAESIFNDLGLGMTSAFSIFLKAVIRNNGIPFALEIPNNETKEAFQEGDDIVNGKKKAKKYNSANSLRKDLKV